MIPRLSSEVIHATTVASGERAVVITGRSGSGKSDLALRLLDRGFTLVSDDQTLIRRDGDRLIANAPPTIAGKLEIRGIGIVEVATVSDVPIALAVELSSEFARMPEDGQQWTILGLSVPMITVDALTASAAAKVAFGLDHRGVKS